MKISARIILVIGCMGLVAMAGSLATAQSIWLEPPSDTDINLEVLKPNIKNRDLTTFSLVYYLSARIRLAPRTQLVTEVPFAAYSQQNNMSFMSSSQGDNAFGNPYLGMAIGECRRGWLGEVGVRLPMAESGKRAVGMAFLADFLERAEAFLPEVLALSAGANYRYHSSDGFALRLRFVPQIWIGTGKRASMDPEIFLLYAAQAGYQDARVAVGGGLSGRYFATSEQDGGIGEKTMHQFGLYGNFNFGGWGAGLQARIPLDQDLADMLDPTLSLSVSLKIN